MHVHEEMYFMERLVIKSIDHPVQCLFMVGHNDFKGLAQPK